MPGSRPIFPPRGVHLCRRLPRMGMLFARLCCCARPVPLRLRLCFLPGGCPVCGCPLCTCAACLAWVYPFAALCICGPARPHMPCAPVAAHMLCRARRALRQGAVFVILNTLHARGTKPVSYTHLDVYKRQVKWCATAPAGYFRKSWTASKQISCSVCRRAAKKASILSRWQKAVKMPQYGMAPRKKRRPFPARRKHAHGRRLPGG